MKPDHRFILHLVAVGRITSAEAERLLAACNDSRETLWALAVCMAAVGLAQLHPHWFLPGLAHMVKAILPASINVIHHTAMFLTSFIGGMQ